MQILVTGFSAGGKSALTRKISEKFDIPRLEMDRLWFECGGHDCQINGCTPEEDRRVKDCIQEKVQEFLSTNDQWVIDGAYVNIDPLVAEWATIVVVIRRPVLKRLASHIYRVLRGRDRHPETGRWRDLLFVKTILRRFWRGENKKLDTALAPYQDKAVSLTSFKEIDAYFESL